MIAPNQQDIFLEWEWWKDQGKLQQGIDWQRKQLYFLIQANKSGIHHQMHLKPPLFQVQQRSIGWDQLYYGHIAMSWAQYIKASNTYATNGPVFYTQVTKCLW